MATTHHLVPPDEDQRNIIRSELDTTLLVEAAAGTGKTTGMVNRMVNLLAAGKCSVDTLAAVTFTRKAAAELRSRFQIELEKACREATLSSRGLLRNALEGMERCFIGTIHSFCARMLRERPVEAGVDLEFEEMDDAEDDALRRHAWAVYVNSLYASGHPILEELEDLGIEVGRLGYTFRKIADYLDVDEWPASAVPAPDLTHAMDSLADLVRHMEQAAALFPESPGTDPLMPKYRIVPLMFRQARRTGRTSEIMEVLAQFKRVKPVFKYWPSGKDKAEEELARWDEFRTSVAEPLLKTWMEHRYEPLLRAVLPALKVYERLRSEAGKLNYQDLLIKAARLLRDETASRVRDYFRTRFTHILVDEFQDTDPIQAEVIMLLTAENSRETDWRKCRPVPGSLFVVGDPKQSIYRFRRADIVTYNQVKEIIRRNGGKVVTLTANFRTTKPLIDWVNATFENEFQKYPADCSPEYTALDAVRDGESQSKLTGVRSVRVPKSCKTKDLIGEYEGTLIARTIRDALDRGLKIPRSPSELAAGVPEEVEPGDFLIVTPKTGNLHVYSRTLEELRIPHQVTGGTSLNQVRELKLLHTLLTAVTQPDNSPALVAVLRGDLFGISDPELFAFTRAGGTFSFSSPLPEGLDSSTAAQFSDAFGRLARYARWLTRYPPVSAFERIAADIGLTARAAASNGGDAQAGSFLKALELIRGAQRDYWSVADLTTYLGKLVAQDEGHDAVSASPPQASVVRLMNLHKVKGLEAPVVFLADPTGKKKHPVELYVDRTADKVRGYMAIEESRTGFGPPILLAHPPRWDEYSAIEENFQEAEELRLLYVAATRAGCGLTITGRESHSNMNPWAFFDTHLAGRALLEDPGPRALPTADRATVSPREIAAACKEIDERLHRATMRTYDVAAAKISSLQLGEFTYSFGEHGTEWGTVIHLLLETAMLDRDADIRTLAEAVIADQGLDSALAQEATATVESVIQSDVWRRACTSTRRLVEVPFQRLVPADGEAGATDTILRGVIDLAFEEPEGWVIVDYKSDRVPEGKVRRLVDLYTPQVLSYADAWREITGLEVSEVGLYFTHARTYVTVPVKSPFRRR
ncbi:MAG: UvrD-helicase domain-containing protein [Desulfomonilaceae bacterium]|nr:UvrD-helicase domain-containing protein [Desulfomonilaceae bacterium]